MCTVAVYTCDRCSSESYQEITGVAPSPISLSLVLFVSPSLGFCPPRIVPLSPSFLASCLLSTTSPPDFLFESLYEIGLDSV